MNIAVIGGGVTGLTAAYELTKQGHSVTVFERDTHLGGLAWGWREKNWQWHLEGAYHHLFTNDRSIINLINELGIGDKLIIKRPVTANYVASQYINPAGGETTKFSPDSSASGKTTMEHRERIPRTSLKTDLNFPLASRTNERNQIYQLDSPAHLFQFPGLSITDKLRTGALAAFCKIFPFWQPLENITAKKFFKTVGGTKAWDIIWEPLMTGKFGHLDSTIAASWLWARINKRTPSLCYIEGGFQTFVETLASAIIKNSGTIRTGITISTIQQYNNTTIDRSDDRKQIAQFSITVGKQQKLFDKILLTVPTPIAYKLIPAIREDGPLSIPHLHAQVLVLETKEPILDNIYWLSITDRSFPFLAVVAHTNFMDKKHYGGHHLTYVGNYLPEGHPYLSMHKDQLLKKFLPFIQRISHSEFKILNSTLFFGPFAQPVQQLHYSKKAPKLITSVPGIYLANMDSIYPWDRGTNYAVELGQKAAKHIMNYYSI